MSSGALSTRRKTMGYPRNFSAAARNSLKDLRASERSLRKNIEINRNESSINVMKYLKPPYPVGKGPHMSQWMRKRAWSARVDDFRGNFSRLILARAHMRQLLTWTLSIGSPVVACSSPLTSIWPTRRWKNPVF